MSAAPTNSVTESANGKSFVAELRRSGADTPKSHTAYQDFLALWKDADPDIPILKQAKIEYAKLQ